MNEQTYTLTETEIRAIFQEWYTSLVYCNPHEFTEGLSLGEMADASATMFVELAERIVEEE